MARVALAALLLGGAGSARAQAPASESAKDPELEAAKAEFESGVALYLKEQYDAAAGKYLAAFDKKPFPAFLFNAGVAYEKGKRLELAKQYYEKYLAADANAPDAADVKTRIEAIKNILNPPKEEKKKPAAALPAIATKGLVIIDSRPPGATIYFNDKMLGSAGVTPWNGSLPSGNVTLIVEAQGFKPVTREISPRSDKVLDVIIEMSQEHYLGFVDVTSNAIGADVFIDNKADGARGRTPFTGHLKPGKHTIYVAKRGYVEVAKEFDLQPGTATKLRIDLEKVAFGWINVMGKHTKGAKLFVTNLNVEEKNQKEELACNTPCTHEVQPGKYHVRVEHPEMEDYEGDVDVERSAYTNIGIQWNKKPSKAKAITATVIGGLSLTAGIVVGTLGKNQKDAISKDIKAGLPIDSNDPRRSSGRLKYWIADGLFAVAGVAGLLATIGFLSSGDDSIGYVEEKSLSFAPVITPDGAGMGAQWRF